MNALDHCQLTPSEKEGKIQGFSTKSTGYSQRYDTLLPKLVEKLSAK